MKYRVTDFLPQEEIAVQLGEEAAELSKAALKLHRVLDGRNPTPVGYAMAVKNLMEEIADVTVCLDQLHCIDWDKINDLRKQKLARWITRLMDAREKEDAGREWPQEPKCAAYGGDA